MKINKYKTSVFRFLCMCMVCLLFGSNAQAQWEQTNGPYAFGDGGTSISCLAVSGINIFAGTNRGVFLSNDNGTSWQSVNIGLDNINVWSFAISDTNIFAGTNGGGVFLSTNNGNSWTAINNGLINLYVWSLAVSGSNIFAGTNDGVFISTNNGTSWTSINNGMLNRVVNAIVINSTNIFTGTPGDGVFLSTNNGNSWTAVNNGLVNKYIWSLVISGTNIFAGTNDGVFLSSNNGISWIHVTNGMSNMIVKSLAVSGTNIFAGTSGDGVFLSTTNGNLWTQVTNGMTNTYIWSLAVSGTNIFAGTNGGGVFLSTSNGTSWRMVNNGITNTTLNALAVSGMNIFAGTSGDGVFLSTNNGFSWKQVTNGITNTVILSLAISGTNILAGTSGGGVFLSTNNGTNWVPKNNGLLNMSIKALTSINSNIFAGTLGGGVFRSTNNGTDWVEVNSGLGYLNIYTIFKDGTNLFAGTEFYGDIKGIYMSTDFGTNWVLLDSSIENPTIRGTGTIFSFAKSDTTLFAGSSFGVFHSTNYGKSWSRLDSNPKNKIVRALIVQDNFILSGTFGGGVYISINNGTSWNAFNNGLQNLYITSFVINGNTLFAGTDNSGVWKLDISPFGQLSSIAIIDTIILCQLSDTTLSVKTTGGTKPYSYSWSYSDGTLIPPTEIFSGGITDSSLQLKPSQTKNYRCIVSDSLLAKDTVLFTVTVTPTPTPIITQNGNELQSDLADSYQWFDSAGTPISGATTQTYTPSTNGTYSVRVTKNGCTGESSGFVYTSSNPSGCITVLSVDAGDWVYKFPEGKPFSVQINNRSSQNCSITKLDITNPNFRVVGSQFPIELAAGDSELIAMRYVPTVFGNDSGTICAVSNCNSCNICGKVTGRGVDTSSNTVVTTIILHPSKDSVSVGEEFTVYLVLEQQNPRLPTGTYDWIGQFQYDGRVLYDRDLLPNKQGKIPPSVVNPMIGYWNNEETGDTLYKKSFLVKLADLDSISLSFKKFNAHEGFEWIYTNNTDIKFVYRLIDSVVYIRICNDDGKQYIRFPASDNIKTIAPNPSTGSSTITLSIGIEGECSVSLVDIFGRVIRETHYDKLSKGEHTMQFDDTNLESGTYYVVMRTGFTLSSQKISVVR